jgi:hypothetical protein
VPTWETDFRAHLPKIDVPVLVIQSDADRILPFPNTGKRLPGLLKDMQLVVIEGGPHAIAWTHADQVNHARVNRRPFAFPSWSSKDRPTGNARNHQSAAAGHTTGMPVDDEKGHQP